MKINYTLKTIRFSVCEDLFRKALRLYEKGMVTNFKEERQGFRATAQGSRRYKVAVSWRNYDLGSCNCRLGRDDIICEHMIATAIYALKKGDRLTVGERKPLSEMMCSGTRGVLTEEQLFSAKRKIDIAMRYIMPKSKNNYDWEKNQYSLEKGCYRLSHLISELPVSKQTSDLVVEILLRVDKKLSVGVDDCNYTVRDFIDNTVGALIEYVAIDKNCINSFAKLPQKECYHEWKELLIKIFDEDIPEE